MRLLLLNGPNLNLLGTRAPEVYGTTTLAEVESQAADHAAARGATLEVFQSNHEGALIDRIHAAKGSIDGIVFNPGAFTHTSYALHDAIEAVEIPTVEIHISNVRAREDWRRISRIGPATVYQIFGRGIDGYRYAIDHLVHRAAMPYETISYGPEPDQVGDLRLPAGGHGPHPVIVIYHGGFWREVWTRDVMDGLAVDLTRHGFATLNLEYRRIPPVGGWRDTVSDATAGLDRVAALADRHALDPNRVLVLGHSAGAHLALSAARHAKGVAVARAVSLAGVLDLAGCSTAAADDPVRLLLGDEVDSRLTELSPIQHLPLGVPLLIGHGRDDEVVPISISERFVAAAEAAGDSVEHLWLDDVDHMMVIDPDHAAWVRIRAHL